METTTKPATATTRRNCLRVERRCPRCGDHSYHWAVVATHRITCNDCGHIWTGRLKKDEVE